ncbi:MAG TPA: ATP-binding cassette domain-containing protein [Actinomycetota bacterium]|nr:ATP-binding cassette domain-containing protein [Actinomycetota bacterium]
MNPPGSGPAIEARGLVKTYPKDVRALDDLSFGVEEGSIFGLLGPNGAGKTTAVKILTTLSRPDEGRARVDGIDVLAEPDAVRRRIGVVAQRSGVDREATGRENLLLQGRIHGIDGRTLDARVDALLERFGLSEAAGRRVRTYSGGMQRRLDIATAMVHRPRALFLDEPTTGLDPEVRAAMWEMILDLAREEGLSVLLTTHYLEEADHLADRVAIVERGRIVTEGTPEHLKGELRGDALLIELADADGDRAVAALEGMSGVRETSVEDGVLRARVDSGATAAPAVLTGLGARGVRVASLTIARPSLDDVYLRHTGRAFAAADREGRRPGDGMAGR